MAGGEGVGVGELISAKRQDRDDTLGIHVIIRLFIPKNIFLHIIFLNAEKAFLKPDSFLPTVTSPLPILPCFTKAV